MADDITVVIMPESLPIQVTITEPEPIVITMAEQGPPGPSGLGAPPFYFLTPSTQWTVNHNLGRKPIVAAYSVGGVEMWAEVLQVSINQAILIFDDPTAGYAICS